MGVELLVEAVQGYKLLALDTMVFSYHLANHPRYASLTSAVLRLIESGEIAGLTTTITLAEVLTVPAQANDLHAMQDYEIFLTNFPNLHIALVDTVLAREIARVRTTTHLRMPDAVQVAAARLHQADAILTNDQRWVPRVSQPNVLLLDAFLDAD